MLKDIVQVKPLNGHRLQLTFEDGIEGIVDVSKLVGFHGVFESLNDPTEFARVRVNRELGCVEWPNGADLDPDVLYDLVASCAKTHD